ncbi:MAG TPA: sulfatase [Sumerlaeia bacterium]|nr:sulfatase [Sumerlaeia bacterium]
MMNIILLISDTFRYDNLFDRAKAMPVRTPNLDAFSERAVSLSNMFMASFPTIPHRTDVTTGRYGWPWHGWQPIDQSGKNQLPSILRPAGYVSQLLCDCPHLFNSRFQHAFDGAMAVRGQEGDKPFLRMNQPVRRVMPPEKTRHGVHFQGASLPDLATWTNQRRWYREEDRFAPRTARLTVEWLEENSQWDPFFLWVDFFDPHEPWDPPEYMVKRYDPDYDGTPMIHPNYGKASDLTPAELRNLRAHYCALAEIVDRWVGRVLQKIDDLDLWKNSIVIFTTDHGTSLGEHNRTGKSNIRPEDERCWPVYPEIARIPFLVAAPGLEGGRTVDALSQPPDILPTLLDLAGVDGAETPDPVHGISFAPHLRGETADEIHEIAITASCLRGQGGKEPAKWVTPVVYTKRWAYAPIGAAGERELCDMACGDDPYAEKNVIADNRNVAEDLHQKMLAWMREIDAPADTIAVFE